MAILSARFLAARSAEGLCPSDYFVLHALPAWRGAAVAGIPAWLLVHGQVFFQLGYSLVLLVDLVVQGFYVTVQPSNLCILLTDGLTHQPHLLCHVFQHI